MYRKGEVALLFSLVNSVIFIFYLYLVFFGKYFVLWSMWRFKSSLVPPPSPLSGSHIASHCLWHARDPKDICLGATPQDPGQSSFSVSLTSCLTDLTHYELVMMGDFWRTEWRRGELRWVVDGEGLFLIPDPKQCVAAADSQEVMEFACPGTPMPFVYPGHLICRTSTAVLVKGGIWVHLHQPHLASGKRLCVQPSRPSPSLAHA